MDGIYSNRLRQCGNGLGGNMLKHRHHEIRANELLGMFKMRVELNDVKRPVRESAIFFGVLYSWGESFIEANDCIAVYLWKINGDTYVYQGYVEEQS
jgi:hypothetical protein